MLDRHVDSGFTGAVSVCVDGAPVLREGVGEARALVNGPDLLLWDGPTGSRDQATADAVAALLFDLHQAQRNILIAVTHSLDLAARCQRRFELRAGACSAWSFGSRLGSGGRGATRFCTTGVSRRSYAGSHGRSARSFISEYSEYCLVV